MIVSIASGKGGTGKTTVAVNLALSLASNADAPKILFLDCDVEEPNAHLFLNPTITEREVVNILIPHVDETLCAHHGRCTQVCQFHAIAALPDTTLVFPELCHGCGSCTLACPEQAISEHPHQLGIIEAGRAGQIRFAHGILNVGEPMATPIIRRLKQRIDESYDLAILDAPPGTACPVVESMRGADYVLMVTEPTPFGLHDLRLAVQVARDELRLPVGVVVNQDGIGDKGVDEYCSSEGIPILMRIPLDRRIAEAYSEGITIVEALPEYRERFAELMERIKTGVLT
ncbi:MAG TPA: (4Fe-4S)-binding protein [Chloroflexi bacterium]|nr:(4Fe-4S)-binding protein [Chloroflexota bacterium]